jgi:Intein splicing domain
VGLAINIPVPIPERSLRGLDQLLKSTVLLKRDAIVVERSVSLEEIANGHVPQLEFMQRASEADAAGSFLNKNILALCSRRAAKTTGICGLMATDASERNGYQIYFGKNRPAVRIAIWERIWKPLCDRWFKSKCIHLDGVMVTRFVTGAVVAFTGTDDVAHIDNYLGSNLRRVVIDECFPAGTLIDGRPIETIKVGDYVSCVDHTTGRMARRMVTGLFQKTTDKYLVSLRLSSANVSCTGNHPVFVKGKGYIHADQVAQGDLLLVQGRVYAAQAAPKGDDVLRERAPDRLVESSRPSSAAENTGRTGAPAPGDDSQESHATGCGQGAGVGDPPEDKAHAEDTRRKWPRANQGGGGIDGRHPGMEVELFGGHRDRGSFQRVAISDLLQVGSGGSGIEDGYRGRWSEPLRDGTSDAGSEEGRILAWDRVESVSREEPRSAEGTTVYNLEVEGAHTYFANGVLVHNCQSQKPSVLEPLITKILPPALSDSGGQMILTGTIPEVPAGPFYELWMSGVGWLKRNWNRFQNPHLGTVEYQIGRLADFLRTSKKTADDPLVRRDWYGEFVFDSSVTAYKYNVTRNGYLNEEPEWLEKFIRKYEGDPYFAHIHRMVQPNDGTARHGLMAAVPFPGIDTFSCAIDPGSRDRFSMVVNGWGSSVQTVQHVFEFSSARKARLSWSHLDPMRRLIQQVFGPVYWFYDAGGSKVVLDTFVGDTGLPALQPAAKSGLHGQVERVSDLMILGQYKVMLGSASEEDYQKTRWDPDARSKLQWKWASTWHPDPAETSRYSLGAYFDIFEPPADEKSQEQIEREAHELAMRRRSAARTGNVLEEDLDAHYSAEEETQWD